MQQLTDQGRQKVLELAQRYGVSTDAVLVLLQALVNGNGTMAQFNHPELGGAGQWMQGGMTMVGDMFNNALKARVDGLCSALSALLSQQPFRAPTVDSSTNWWPAELGMPNTSGGQNNLRYAYFAGSRRLLVQSSGHVTVYETLDHQISGVGQQQGAEAVLTFTSQHGTVRLADLPIVSVDGIAQPTTSSPAPQPAAAQAATAQESDMIARIEQLAELRQKGIITQEEFAALVRRL